MPGRDFNSRGMETCRGSIPPGRRPGQQAQKLAGDLGGPQFSAMAGHGRTMFRKVRNPTLGRKSTFRDEKMQKIGTMSRETLKIGPVALTFRDEAARDAPGGWKGDF